MCGKQVATMMENNEESRIETTQPREGKPAQRPSNKYIDRGMIGLVLVVAGLLALAGNIWQSEIWGMITLPTLGVIFLAWGFLARSAGPMIPGGILTGLGLGVIAQQTLLLGVNEEARGAIVVLGLALGFLVIMPLAILVEGHTHWWPAIPGGILLIISLALLAGPGGVTVLQALGYLWPVALIAGGAYLLWMMYRSRGREEGERDRERRGSPS
jgi:hypothetical protein